jgi:hypothetical protein
MSREVIYENESFLVIGASFEVNKRRRADSNRRIGVLQTPALTTWPRRRYDPDDSGNIIFGAEEGIRTLDLLLGKETFYH